MQDFIYNFRGYGVDGFFRFDSLEPDLLNALNVRGGAGSLYGFDPRFRWMPIVRSTRVQLESRHQARLILVNIPINMSRDIRVEAMEIQNTVFTVPLLQIKNRRDIGRGDMNPEQIPGWVL